MKPADKLRAQAVAGQRAASHTACTRGWGGAPVLGHRLDHISAVDLLGGEVDGLGLGLGLHVLEALGHRGLG